MISSSCVEKQKKKKHGTIDDVIQKCLRVRTSIQTWLQALAYRTTRAVVHFELKFEPYCISYRAIVLVCMRHPYAINVFFLSPKTYDSSSFSLQIIVRKSLSIYVCHDLKRHQSLLA